MHNKNVADRQRDRRPTAEVVHKSCNAMLLWNGRQRFAAR